MHAKIYEPDTACAAGWLDEVIPGDQLEARVLEHAERLLTLPGSAYAHTKRSLRRRTIEYVRATLESNLSELTRG